ncbi:MAG: histidine kinase [Flavobacteriaceae bacterium]|nr:MAG: histidine kinase [Flavobacteriaceae bacterium]
MSKFPHISESWFKGQKILLILLAIIILVFGIYVEQAQEEGNYPLYQVIILWLLLLFFWLWFGNVLLFRAVERSFPKALTADKRFGLQLLLSLLFTMLYINVSYWFFKNRYTALPPNDDQFMLLNIYGLLFLIPVFSVQFGYVFLKKWKKANLEQEQMKKEQISSELITLKSHLSPHFMFNNLNILSSLIAPKNMKALRFLDGFSEVYRYVLQNNNAELVVLQEELEFLNYYVFLLRQRFQEELQIKFEVADAYHNHLIPPLALQMLLENALKHNIMSPEKPLVIKIYTTDAPSITVTNNIALREVPDYEKTGMGLENIKRRYQLISKQEISILNEGNTFKVDLPLLSPKKI